MLIIFEGPDGCGKTTLAQMLVKHTGAHYYAFPGREPGTLGDLVYHLHHRTLYPAMNICEESLQLLHIVAHINALKTRILPWLQDGQTVVLDRFYWSTRVYGLAYGVPPAFLERIINVEKVIWDGWLDQALLFYVTRPEPFEKKDDPKAQERWQQINAEYSHQFRMADPNRLYNRFIINNEAPIETVFHQIVQLVNQTYQFQVR